jgi:pimeloyl-ACP methyl ester carboxylesterase
MCDSRLWEGGDEVVVNKLEQHLNASVIHADTAHDDSIAAMAERALAATDGAILPVGFSMGAIVAVEMWCRAPERVAGLVLIGYNASDDLPDRAAHRPLQQAKVRHGELERVLVEELKPNYLAPQHRGDDAMLSLLRDMGLSLGADVFVQQSEALRLRADRRPILPNIKVPALLGCGAQDGLCPPEWHATWARLIPDATNFVIDSAGHLLPLEAPQALADQIARWLVAKEIA